MPNPIKKTRDKSSLSPMLQEYVSYQEKYSDCLVLIQVGDFYETFFDDAKILANTLNITLTSRDKNAENPIPMAGIPCQALEPYAKRLLAVGKSIAVVSQKPSSTGKNIERYLERMITPGVTFHSQDSNQDSLPVVSAVYFSNYALDLNYLEYTLVYCNPQSGKINFINQQGINSLLRELQACEAKEVILPRSFGSKNIDRRSKLVQQISALPNLALESIKLRELYSQEIEERCSSVKDFLTINSEIKKATSLLINYIDEVSVSGKLEFISVCEAVNKDKLYIDPTTRKNLELCQNLKNNTSEGTLFSVIDKTKSVLGQRMLLNNIKAPLSNLDKIKKRQVFIREFINQSDNSETLHEFFEAILDLESVVPRIELFILNPKEVASIRDTLSLTNKIRESLSEIFAKNLEDPIFKEIFNDLNFDQKILNFLENSISDSPPQNLKDCGIIKKGFDTECDRLNSIKENGKNWLLQYEAEEKEKTGVNSLKIKFNNVLGYFIELTKANASKALDEYEKRQKTVNSERFITTRLKELEAEILGADELLLKRERELFDEIKNSLKKEVSSLRLIASGLANLDMFLSFFKVSYFKEWILPEVSSANQLEIIDGEHPVLEELLTNDFIPNSLEFSEATPKTFILTGPNMGGKSTYLRQNALIVILAHMGMPVPAKKANVGLIDKIFARIGASDDLLEGESTFMVEMRETAFILSQATKSSLILIDELGRGTATHDGEAIAFSVLNYLVEKVKARTIFATHFHSLCNTVKGVRNIRVGLLENSSGLTLTHKIESGFAEKSFGIEVAKRAGLPDGIIELASSVIKEELAPKVSSNLSLEKETLNKNSQTSLFKVNSDPKIEEMANSYRKLKKEFSAIPIDNTTPLEALNILSRLKNKY